MLTSLETQCGNASRVEIDRSRKADRARADDDDREMRGVIRVELGRPYEWMGGAVRLHNRFNPRGSATSPRHAAPSTPR